METRGPAGQTHTHQDLVRGTRGENASAAEWAAVVVPAVAAGAAVAREALRQRGETAREGLRQSGETGREHLRHRRAAVWLRMAELDYDDDGYRGNHRYDHTADDERPGW